METFPMSPVEQRLRSFLLLVAGGICVGTVVELALSDHFETLTQLIPFGLAALGLLAVAAAFLRPQRSTLLGLRVVMGLLIFGSLFGVYEHLSSNLLFELEMRPGAIWTSVFVMALKGASPLLAPGILALAGMLASAATYQHPALQRKPAATAVREPQSITHR